MHRRQFLQSTVAAGALAATARAAERVAANDKVTVGMIGVRGRGRGLTDNFASLPDVDIAYLCDVDERVFGPALKSVEDSGGKKPKLVSDLRRLLDDKSIDAVVVATPDHWHAPATILACDAGKDVYVEKPCSHNFREGALMVEAARRGRRVVQHGTQGRSVPLLAKAIEYIRSGELGEVLSAKAWNIQARDDIGHKEDSPTPKEVDFDIWTGPAVKMPFNENRFHYTWHWNWNYGTGDIGNDGVHQLDAARWALGVDTPKRVSGSARRLYFDNDQQTPDTMTLVYDFGDKEILFEMRDWNPYGALGQQNAVGVYGDGGWAMLLKAGYQIFDRKGKLVTEEHDTQRAEHQRNFVDCIKSREAPNAEIAIGHASSMLAHLGNIVARTGRQLEFDAAAGKIAGDEQANAFMSREYRQHWSTPSGV